MLFSAAHICSPSIYLAGDWWGYSVQQLEELKSAHFTVCQKPWACWKQHDNRLCNDLHRRYVLMVLVFDLPCCIALFV